MKRTSAAETSTHAKLPESIHSLHSWKVRLMRTPSRRFVSRLFRCDRTSVNSPTAVRASLGSPTMSLRRRLVAGAIVARANLTLFERPDRLPRAMIAMRPWGSTLAGLVAASAARYPNTVAIVDESGATTYEELWRRSQSVAAGLVAAGVAPGSVVGLLGRNHRGFVEALIAVSAIGADVVLLNTGFAGPQLADVAGRRGNLARDPRRRVRRRGGRVRRRGVRRNAARRLRIDRCDGGSATDAGAGRDPDLWHHRAAQGCRSADRIRRRSRDSRPCSRRFRSVSETPSWSPRRSSMAGA